MQGTRPLYRPDIDGLRALAVLSVMIFHLNSNWLPGGFTGVDVFFVISGFVVTSSLAQSKAINIGQFISLFYARRLARIMPALLFCLLVTIVCATLFIPAAWLSSMSSETARYAFFGLSNVVLQNNTDTYFAPRTEYNPYTHTWSLGVEEQFYLLVPVLIYFWVKVNRTKNTQSIVKVQTLLTLLALASLAGCIYATQHYPRVAFYSIATRFWELALGAGLYMATHHSAQNFKFTPLRHAWKLISPIAPAIGLALICSGFVLADGSHFPWPWALLPVVGTALLIGGANLKTLHPIRHHLGNASLVWIGKRSYSLYLWHWPVYVLLRWTIGLERPEQYVLALVATLLLSMFSYRYIEQPLRHNAYLEKLPSWINILVFLALLAGTYAICAHILRHPGRYSLSVVMHQEQDWYRNGLSKYPNMVSAQCQSDYQTKPIFGGFYTKLTPKASCYQSTSEQKPTQQVFILGDSHAEALFPVFEQLSAQHHLTVFLYTYGGCSFIDFRAPMEKGFSPACNTFNHEISQAVLRQAKPGDLVFLPSLRMKRYADQWASFGIEDMHEYMYNTKAKELRQEATTDAQKWITPFVDAKLKVVFVAPPPILKSPTFRCMDWFNRTHPICSKGLEVSKEEMVLLRAPILQQMQTLKTSLNNVLVWDPFDILCPNATCGAILDGRPVLFDGDHISNYANWLLYPYFNRWLIDNQLISNN